ncbi:4-coumarate-ligase 2 [Diplodia corticola]|uniref:4-coumarate-ligase 2 n=1 Tax=Diplodia corticola TaxID=236234 RepID=A0A1J9R957_9PEZI|nr:4-coumarate-ligase 2 [Diplodia corticola]OJD37088.1 4-coumarate-ligase 2 [Diplodia corticola]
MKIYKSRQPDIEVPTHLTTWDWLFDSPYSPLSASRKGTPLAGFIDATTSETLDWEAVRSLTTYLSTALVRKLGLREGETVSLFSPNSVWYPVAMHGALRAGARVSGASPAYGVEEMAYALRTAKTRVLIAGRASLGVAVEAARKAGLDEGRVVLLEGKGDGKGEGRFETVKGLIEWGGKQGESNQVPAFKIPAGKKNGEVCGFLSFSSGTTGLPKAVMISHQNVIAQCLQIQQITPADHDKVLAVLPAFHITGLVHVLHLPILINAAVIMLPSFTMRSMLSAVQKYRIRELLLVPPILIRLVRDPVVSEYDLSCVRRFSSGAAPLSAEILQQLRERFPGTGFKQGYGMTESCSCITAHPPDRYGFAHAHTVGTLVANTELRVVRPGDGTDVPDAAVEPGELLARGPQVVMGYLDNAAATRQTFDADGWLHTGDQGTIAAASSGLVTITDRIKEMIKVKGVAVAPAELEDLLLGHAKVDDAAVLGVPDDYAGEVPKAYVVLKPGVVGDDDKKGGHRNDESESAVRARRAVGRELLAYVRDNKVRDKRVREIEFVDEIPKSASGKILRRVLRDKDATREGTVRTRGLVVRYDAVQAERAAKL